MKKSLEKSDELLRKTNMELFTANEELQASNEELNASNEEFEAINEELVDSQRRIEENEKKLRAMLEHLPLPVLFVKERDIEFMNLAFTRTFGHSRTESPVMSAIMERLFLDEHARERVINEFVETASTLQSGEGRALGIHKMACRDGTMRDIDLKVSRMDNMSIVLFNDITEKRMMEKERDRLIALIEATSDMVSMSTPDTSVFYINNAGRKMLDIGHANPLSLKITDLHPLWAYEIIKTEGLPAAIEKGTWQGETAVLTGKGGEIPVSQVIISHKSPEGPVDYFSTIIRDISERRKTHELMVQTEKMTTVGGLAAGMAHEINNPLGVILQAVQMVSMRISCAGDADRKEAEKLGLDHGTLRAYAENRGIVSYLEGIREAGERAARIVSNMLQFSRRGESRATIEDINLLIENALSIAISDYDLKKRYDIRKILIERDLDRAMPPLLCSATEIEQVVLNLVKNAAQAGSPL
jgi:PAS domain S-box-containing protein